MNQLLFSVYSIYEYLYDPQPSPYHEETFSMLGRYEKLHSMAIRDTFNFRVLYNQ